MTRIDDLIFEEGRMARPRILAKMSVEALLELRDSVTAAISEQAERLKAQLSRLTSGNSVGNGRGRPPGKRGSKLKAAKLLRSTAARSTRI